MVDTASRLADLNIDALLAALEADAAAQPALPPPSAVSNGHSEERRSARRLDRDELSGEVRLTIPGVSGIVPVNISESGVLIETSRPLRPGMAADLFVRLNGKRHALRATTVRSTLHGTTSMSGAVYRTALQFDRPLSLESEEP